MTTRSSDQSDGSSVDSSTDDSSTGNHSTEDAVAGVPDTSGVDDVVSARRPTGAPARRPNPAASAASRARRIGGATGAPRSATNGADTAGSPAVRVDGASNGAAHSPASTDSAAADSGAASAATRSRLSLRKRARPTNPADEPKAATQTDGSVVTEVPGWLRWAPATVLTACAVAMIVIIGIAAHGVWYAKPSSSVERDKVLAAAKKCMAAVNTYNYTTLTADEKTGLACTTGDWTAQYKSALTKIVIPTATQLKASQTVRINAAGIESVTDNGRQWTTIVYGQVTLNQSGATPRIDPFSAVVRMDKVSPTYKISKIDLITTPNT